MFPNVIQNLSLKQYSGQEPNVEILWEENPSGLPSQSNVQENKMEYRLGFSLLKNSSHKGNKLHSSSQTSTKRKFLPKGCVESMHHIFNSFTKTTAIN